MRDMTGEEAALARIIVEHKGSENAIKGKDLARRWRHELGGIMLEPETRPVSWQRRLRKIVNTLIFDFGMPIIGDHSRGYYLVGSLAEINTVCETLRKHALHELHKAARLKKITPGELLGQLTFDFLDEIGADMPGLPDDEMPPHLVAITSILARYTDDPDKYAGELKVLRDKYAPLFVTREDAEKLKEAQSVIGKILGGLFGTGESPGTLKKD